MATINSIFDFPSHLQGEAWLYAQAHDGRLPSLAALLRHYGRPNRVGRADVEKLPVTLLSKLYATVVTDGESDALDASYAVHCRLAKLVGESVVRDLAAGYSKSEVCERNAISRMTLHRALKLLQSEA